MSEFYLTSPVSYRSKFKRIHTGIDIAIKGEDIHVFPILPGRVTYVNKTRTDISGGLSVHIESHSFSTDINGRTVHFTISQKYYHFSSIYVEVGDSINYSTVLGIQGNTGTVSTGPHVHVDLVIKRNDYTPVLYVSPFMLRLMVKSSGKSYFANATKFIVSDQLAIAVPNEKLDLISSSVLFISQKKYKFIELAEDTVDIISKFMLSPSSSLPILKEAV